MITKRSVHLYSIPGKKNLNPYLSTRSDLNHCGCNCSTFQNVSTEFFGESEEHIGITLQCIWQRQAISLMQKLARLTY